jgi:putative hemolysin
MLIERNLNGMGDRNWVSFDNACIGCSKTFSDAKPIGYLHDICSSTTTTTTLIDNIYSNPYRNYCEAQGYAYRLKKSVTGREYGICVFSTGKWCDAIEYFNGICGK